MTYIEIKKRFLKMASIFLIYKSMKPKPLLKTIKLFFLYLPFNLPHYPEQPDPKFKDTYKDLKWPRSSYAPMISTIDDKMGEVIKTLEDEGLTDNTIIIYRVITVTLLKIITTGMLAMVETVEVVTLKNGVVLKVVFLKVD